MPGPSTSNNTNKMVDGRNAGASSSGLCKAYCTGTEDEVLIVRRGEYSGSTNNTGNGNYVGCNNNTTTATTIL